MLQCRIEGRMTSILEARFRNRKRAPQALGIADVITGISNK